MQIDTDNKGKEVVPPMEKGKEVVPPMEVGPTMPEEVAMDEDVVSDEPPSGKRRNYGHYQEEGGLTHFCKGWPPFAAVHQIRISYMVTFKLLTSDTLKVIVFDDEGIEVVTKCGKHDYAFALNV
ncbi:hypothetical protein VPH35_029885 [Triticum aestivum]